MDFLELGQKIREARLRAGLSQTDLARPLGMSRATVSDLENGTIKELGVRKLVRLCQRLGLDLYLAEKRRPTLHEAYEENRRLRQEAIRQIEGRPAGGTKP
jgi:transcriptional regulator with XRE-family HTH domain